MKTTPAVMPELQRDVRMATIRRWLARCALGMLLAFPVVSHGETAVEAWVQRYGFGGIGSADTASKVVTDAAGNVIVAGDTDEHVFLGKHMLIIKYSGAGVPLWTNRYNGPGNGNDSASDIAVDASGNVFVTGFSASINTFPPDYAFATIKYSSTGVPVWTNRYNGPGNGDDMAIAIAVDASGNAFVTGNSPDASSTAYATIKYSNAGMPLWTNRYLASVYSTSAARAMAVDASGNVFVTGFSDTSGSNADYATVAYSGAGVPLWTNLYDNGYSDVAGAIAVDSSGNAFVTGYSAVGYPFSLSDYATVAYSGAGVPLWTNRYNGPANGDEYPRAIAVDTGGNVFVTGASGDNLGGKSDWATLAYSGTGAPLWTNRYDGPDSSRSDYATGVAVDSNGNVFVTGQSYEAYGDASDIATVAYSGAGQPLWTNRYNGGPAITYDRAWALAVDASGNVFVTGSSYRSGGVADYATIAYSGAGLPLWTNRYHDSGDSQDSAWAIAVDASGNVIVTGISMGNGTSYDFATVAYSGTGVPLWTNRYNGPGNGTDAARAIAVDASGNVFVTGVSIDTAGSSDYATIAYSGAGVPLWTNRYNGPSNGGAGASAIAVDATGKVFVTGASADNPGGKSDWATIAYSGAGVPLWTNRYSGSTNVYEAPSAIKVDASGNVVVTGHSTPDGGASDYVTIKYSGAGVPLWTNRYNGPGNGPDGPQGSYCLAIGPDGAVYVTGASDGVSGSDTGFDYATIKYVTLPELAIQPLVAGASGVNLTLSGSPNSVWTIERAVALPGPWTHLGPVTIPTSGSQPFQDPSPPKPAAFYRARQ